jgi:CubicO group peptidase (beta-lactamase class C family)
MTHKHWTSIALSVLAVGLTLHTPSALRANDGSDFSPAQVDTYLQAGMQHWQIPGLAVAVIRNDTLALVRSYGLANIELGAPTSPGSVFEIGPISKQFTAAAVMMLVEEGKMGLDQPIRSIMPELPQQWSEVTVRHLLSHTSGLPSYTAAPGYPAERQSSISKNQILASVANQPVRFKPGERASTSSTDYFVLGLLIERASGKSYAQFLSQRIFQPLEMTSTRVNDYDAIIKGRAAGYTAVEEGSPISPTNAAAVHPSRLFGSAALVSSVTDLTRWHIALVTGRVLKAPSLKAMLTPAQLRDGTSSWNGFGWRFHSTATGQTSLDQFGATEGFASRIVYNRSDGITVIVLANSSSPYLYALADGVHRIVVGQSAVVAR